MRFRAAHANDEVPKVGRFDDTAAMFKSGYACSQTQVLSAQRAGFVSLGAVDREWVVARNAVASGELFAAQAGRAALLQQETTVTVGIKGKRLMVG